MTIKRRDFLKSLAVGAGAALATKPAKAVEKVATQAVEPASKWVPSPDEADEFVGVICDVTRCIGCRACEVACAEANELPIPDVKRDGALKRTRKTSFEQRTVVNKYETDKGDIYVKKQCMHCWQPACATSCPTNAMNKTHLGPVTWDGDKCMGCRYCMVGCPFNIPKYEYDSWNPRIQKCDMCYGRLEKGQEPACVAACPADALTFGLKSQLIEKARARIYNEPDKYVHHIYGEEEVGGTGWMYLSPVPFDQIGFRTDLGTVPYPDYTKEFLFSVPAVFLVAPTLLLGMHQLSKHDDPSPSHDELKATSPAKEDK